MAVLETKRAFALLLGEQEVDLGIFPISMVAWPACRRGCMGTGSFKIKGEGIHNSLHWDESVLDVGHGRKSPQGGRDCFQIECHMSRFSLQNLRPNNLTSSESVASPVMLFDLRSPLRSGR